ncbi:methionyl-tRNA formyltransferase [Hydrogenophaga crassostreae]|uniref:Methionyl-tRNA formyltransferase n=1 Tax=Hydrogenophaga crassostreae TaxID=1763535 RepID=A0A162VLL8_9BURK|nr:methionyl-tRNA formyltransferase [Hydrogenophaga crassostreae]AOW15127.1 methionyl-tRNA formyltransferase [Hydrogenophaga crassostreae]OAD39216.1 methionyl-tRNA formyltransferase [Hydrogenophaga crassostreae]
MKIIFAGTPEFARVALERLHRAGFEVALVLSQPDRPAGRGMKLQASPVKQYAVAHNMPVAQPRSLRLDGKFPEEAAAAQEAIRQAGAEVMVVAAYGLILPQWVLDAPAKGCLNIHASLLPRWRGAAPIHRAIEAGDAQTGVTIMQMDAGLDTGAMLLREAWAIGPEDTTGVLHDKLADLGGRLIVEALELAACGGLTAEAQPEAGVTYAHKIDKAEAAVQWSDPAADIARRVRAFNPAPGAAGMLDGEAVKIWAAHVEPGGAGAAGEVLGVDSLGIHVCTGDGVLCLTELQRAGGKRLPVADFLRGMRVQVGQVFTAAPSREPR